MKRHKSITNIIIASTALVLASVSLTQGQEEAEAAAATAATTPIYTLEQAELGETGYRQSCQACHHSELQGDDFAAALSGRNFINYWSGRTIEHFMTFTKTQMPLGAPGSLSDETYAEIVSYILHYNGYPAGDTELSYDSEALADLEFGRPNADTE